MTTIREKLDGVVENARHALWYGPESSRTGDEADCIRRLAKSIVDLAEIVETLLDEKREAA